MTTTRRSPTERRAEIDAAAESLALADGLGALTLRGIAAGAGVASGLVAHYEPSIQDLVARTFDRVAGREIAEVDTLLAAESMPLDALRLLVGTLVDGTRSDVSALWADAWSLGRRNPALAAAARGRMTQWHDLAAGVIARLVADGPDADTVAGSVATTLFALVDSSTAYGLVGYLTDTDRADLVTTTLERILRLAPDALTR